MNKENEKKEQLDLISKHQESKEWLSEIQTWQDGIQFMKSKILRFSPHINDENRKLELRTFYLDLDGSLRGRIDWLTTKIEKHELEFKSYFENNLQRSIPLLQKEYDVCKGEMKDLRLKYELLRTDFYELVKPSLKVLKKEGKVEMAS